MQGPSSRETLRCIHALGMPTAPTPDLSAFERWYVGHDAPMETPAGEIREVFKPLFVRHSSFPACAALKSAG